MEAIKSGRLYFLFFFMSLFVYFSCDVVSRGYFPDDSNSLTFSQDLSREYLGDFPSLNIKAHFRHFQSPFSDKPDIIMSSFTNLYTENSRLYAFQIPDNTLKQLISVNYKDSDLNNFKALFSSPDLAQSSYIADGSFYLSDYKLLFSKGIFNLFRVDKSGSLKNIFNTNDINTLKVTDKIDYSVDGVRKMEITYGLNLFIEINDNHDDQQPSPYFVFNHLFLGEDNMREAGLINYDGNNTGETDIGGSVIIKNSGYETHLIDARTLQGLPSYRSFINTFYLQNNSDRVIKIQESVNLPGDINTITHSSVIKMLNFYNRNYFYTSKTPLTPLEVYNKINDDITEEEITAIKDLILGYDFLIDYKHKKLFFMFILSNRVKDTSVSTSDYNEADYIDIFTLSFANGFDKVFRDSSMGENYNEDPDSSSPLSPAYAPALDSPLRDNAIVDYKRFITYVEVTINNKKELCTPTRYYLTSSGIILSYDKESWNDEKIDPAYTFAGKMRYCAFKAQPADDSGKTDWYKLTQFQDLKFAGANDDNELFFNTDGTRYFVYSKRDRKLHWDKTWWSNE